MYSPLKKPSASCIKNHSISFDFDIDKIVKCYYIGGYLDSIYIKALT